MGIGRRIRQLRERCGITQEELAQRLGVTPSAVGNYEREVSHPREEVLYGLFRELSCEPNELFSDCYDTADSKEADHLKMYRELDSHGRELVDACTEIEYRRCTESDGLVLIAARKGGAPRLLKLKKRDGAGSILDEKDYKGGKA